MTESTKTSGSLADELRGAMHQLYLTHKDLFPSPPTEPQIADDLAMYDPVFERIQAFAANKPQTKAGIFRQLAPRLRPGHSSHAADLSERVIAITGGVGIGKTTFLAAVWHALPADLRMALPEKGFLSHDGSRQLDIRAKCFYFLGKPALMLSVQDWDDLIRQYALLGQTGRVSPEAEAAFAAMFSGKVVLLDEGRSTKAGPLLRTIARVGGLAIVTTNYDKLTTVVENQGVTRRIGFTNVTIQGEDKRPGDLHDVLVPAEPDGITRELYSAAETIVPETPFAEPAYRLFEFADLNILYLDMNTMFGTAGMQGVQSNSFGKWRSFLAGKNPDMVLMDHYDYLNWDDDSEPENIKLFDHIKFCTQFFDAIYRGGFPMLVRLTGDIPDDTKIAMQRVITHLEWLASEKRDTRGLALVEEFFSSLSRIKALGFQARQQLGQRVVSVRLIQG